MNFPERWRVWIMATLVSSRASVLVNGSPTMEFQCTRGLRQGDPLSPFLFVIAMEALSGIMKKAVSEGIFKGLKCTRNGQVLSHLIYADDVVFLGEWSDVNALNLRRLLRCFYLVSGLKVNLSKCSVYGVGVDNVEAQRMADILVCNKGSFPFKHLGLVVGANMNLIRNWKPVIDVFKNRLSLWKAKHLSYGGRITLLKSVLNSLPTYFFSLYKAPVKVLEILERLRRVFFWGGSDVDSHMSWMAWEKVIAPIEYGGLGFGSLRDSNLAMLSKWWWRFKTEKDGLWRRVVWAIHHNNRSWAPIPAKISLAGPWKQIVGIRGSLIQFGIDLPCSIRCKVGCGLKEELTDLTLLLCDFVARICPDVWDWCHDTSGTFSVASIKQISASASRSLPEYLFVWNRFVPKKVGIVVWRALSERLPTRVALAARNIYIADSQCLFCGEYEETSEHIFVSCQFSQSIWLIVTQWCRIPPIIAFSLKDIIDCYSCVNGSKEKKKIINAIVQVVIWCLWRMRNDVLFGQASPSISKVVEESKSMAYHWIKNRSGHSQWSWNDWRSFNLGM
ncbi:putative RNA-directed DNA polymerase [Helianthus debilis subsp. tardiflorus]